MKIVFMGSPDFAIPSLEAIHHSDHEILAVVSNIDKRRGRGSGTSPTPVKRKAQDLGYDIIEVDKIDDPDFIEKLISLQPDLLVVVAFRILPKEILDIPEKGSVNLHASLLPKYRGAAPIHRAIINGETETGCTVFLLNEKVDTGKILGQVKVPIGMEDTTGDLYEKLKIEGSSLLLSCINDIADGTIKPKVQDDSDATAAPKIYTEDCHIEFDQPVVQIHNKIRALSPFPTAWAHWKGKKFNMYASRPGPEILKKPGTLFEDEGRLLVAADNGTVELLTVQLPGTKKISAEEFLNGYEAEGELK